MKIRQAELSDYEGYRALFISPHADMLYRAQKGDIKPQKESDRHWFDLDEETKKLIDEELSRTPDKFEQVLGDYHENRIYIVEDKKAIVGFFEMFRIGTGKWKLAFCGMKQGYRTQDTFTKTVGLLMKQSGVSQVDVCVIYPSCEHRMEEAGFTPIGGGFYRKSSKKRE